MRQKLSRWLKIIAGVTLLLFLMVISFRWLKGGFWRVKKIDCQLSSHECPPELQAELMRLFQQENLIFLSSSEVVQKVRQTPFKLGQVKLKKRFPDGLIFELEEKKPKAALTIEGATDAEFYLIDQEGGFIEKTTTAPPLPLIFVNHPPELKDGEKFDQPLVQKTVFILASLQLRLVEPKLAKIVSEREIEVWLKSDIQAIFSPQKDLDFQLDSLQLILSRTKIEGRKPRRLDLRFDKPVVTYE